MGRPGDDRRHAGCRGSDWAKSDVRQNAKETACVGNALHDDASDLLAACNKTMAHMHAEELDAPTAAELERTLLDAIAKAEMVGVLGARTA